MPLVTPPVKTLVHPDGTTYKLGRNAPPPYQPHLKLKNYLLRGFPNPPATMDETPLAIPSLSRMFLNDQLGCCIISWLYGHQRGVWSANATNGQAIVLPTDLQIQQTYSRLFGYVIGDPSTDDGGTISAAINDLISSKTIEGSISINAHDATELRIGIWLFGGATFGGGLPDEWTHDLSNLNWRVAGDPDPENGHCWGCPGKYDGSTVGTSTWGRVGSMDDASAAKYATKAGGGECYALLSPDWISKTTQKAPTGFDHSQLAADLQALAA
jgi:hypothetical protein